MYQKELQLKEALQHPWLNSDLRKLNDEENKDLKKNYRSYAKKI